MSRLPTLLIFPAREGREYVRLYFPEDKRDCGLRPRESLVLMARDMDLQYTVVCHDMYLDEFLAR